MTRIRELVESILNEGWFGKNQPVSTPESDIEEYLVLTFMRIYGLEDQFSWDEYKNIKERLTKADERFVQLDRAIEKIVQEYERGDVKIDMIADLLNRNGADMDIYDRALQDFDEKEAWKNPQAEMNSWDEWEKYQLDHGLIKVDDQDQMSFNFDEGTVKKGSQWVNKGEEGTHGTFKTKKEADDQRKAMFANGYKG